MIQPVIPFVDLAPQNDAIRKNVEAAWASILDSNQYLFGPWLDRFENDFGEFLKMPHVISVGNGGDALELTLRAVGASSGDEVIVPSNSYAATAMAVQNVGAVPVFADVSKDSHLIDVESVESVISRRTVGIIPVHLYGQMADMPRLNQLAERYGLFVIEDAAQAHGATQGGVGVGSLSAAACFSFYPGKNLGAYGDAGAIVTNSAELAERLRKARNYGGLNKYEHSIPGRNSRMDEVQAAVLSEKLRLLPTWTDQRRLLAESYLSQLNQIQGLTCPKIVHNNFHVWHLFVVKARDRDELQTFLGQRGVHTQIHYPTPLTAIYGLNRDGACPTAEVLSFSILSLPLYPGMTEPQQSYVAREIRSFYESQNSV